MSVPFNQFNQNQPPPMPAPTPGPQYHPVPPVAPPAAPNEAGTSASTGGKQHTIAKGETLWKLAKTYYPASLDLNEEIKKIKAANPGMDDRNLKIGTVINIP